jgi:hypothetical protein
LVGVDFELEFGNKGFLVAVFVDGLVEVALVVIHNNIEVLFIVLVGEERVFH